MGSLAERYEDGGREEAWAELVALGRDAERWDDEVWVADAQRVAAITMARVAANVSLLTVRLTAMGYRFGANYSRNRRRRTIEDLGLRRSMEAAGRDLRWVDQGDVEETVMGWAGPRPDIGRRVAAAEDAVGRPLPLALSALWVAVDQIDLSGSFPSWSPSAYDFDDDLDWPAPGRFSDAFNLLPIDAVCDHVDPGTGRLHPEYLDGDGRYHLIIANGPELSANQVGGTVRVRLGAGTDRIDPVLELVDGEASIASDVSDASAGGARQVGSLVENLRRTFAWGGFPGFAGADGDAPPELAVLRAGLLEI